MLHQSSQHRFLLVVFKGKGEKLEIDHIYDRNLHRIIKLVSQYNCLRNPVHKHTHLIRDLGIDSLSLIELVNDLELEFDIEISYTETASAACFGTVERLASFLENKLKGKQALDNIT